MSDSMNIFVAADAQIEDLVRELEQLLGIHFQHCSGKQSVWYEYVDPLSRIVVQEHELENDSDWNFEDYPYQIEIWGISNMDPAEREKRRIDVGQRVFSNLKSLNIYRLLLLDNLEVKLDEFPATVQQPSQKEQLLGNHDGRDSLN